jgi:hypothetical protein
MNANNTLKIIRAIGMADFRPLSPNDYAAFEGASENAVIAFTGGALSEELSEIVGHPIPSEPQSVAIVIDGGVVELYTWTLDGGYISFRFEVERMDE